MFSRTKFSLLTRVCDRCYELFKDHEVHSLCR